MKEFRISSVWLESLCRDEFSHSALLFSNLSLQSQMLNVFLTVCDAYMPVCNILLHLNYILTLGAFVQWRLFILLSISHHVRVAGMDFLRLSREHHQAGTCHGKSQPMWRKQKKKKIKTGYNLNQTIKLLDKQTLDYNVTVYLGARWQENLLLVCDWTCLSKPNRIVLQTTI